MKKLFFVLQLLLIFSFTSAAYSAEIMVGSKIPDLTIEKKGIITFDYEIKDGKMACKDKFNPEYRPWSTTELKGKVATIYHLAARMGIDDINKDYIDALVEADLPDKLPESSYKTATILNMDDALWGTAGIATKRFCSSQEEFPYAYYIVDQEGKALKKWGLKEENSAVIVIDKKGEVLFFKEGKLTKEEIDTAVSKIKKALEE